MLVRQVRGKQTLAGCGIQHQAKGVRYEAELSIPVHCIQYRAPGGLNCSRSELLTQTLRKYGEDEEKRFLSMKRTFFLDHNSNMYKTTMQQVFFLVKRYIIKSYRTPYTHKKAGIVTKLTSQSSNGAGAGCAEIILWSLGRSRNQLFRLRLHPGIQSRNYLLQKYFTIQCGG